MDDIDRKILNKIQSDFPIVKRPFLDIAGQLQINENEVIDRIKRMKNSGKIRRIGGNFHSSNLGFTSTLCAAKVPTNKLDIFVEKVNSFKEVTHNYIRANSYNVWFTFIAEDMDTIERSLQILSEATGVKDILNLPAQKMFKIKVDFDM